MSVRSRIRPRPRATPVVAPSPARSRRPCPACGAHRVSIVTFPRIDIAGVQPYSDLFGMGDPGVGPQLRCRSCGRAWSDFAAFLAASSR